MSDQETGPVKRDSVGKKEGFNSARVEVIAQCPRDIIYRAQVFKKWIKSVVKE